MNSPITFPPAAPALKLVRPTAEKWAATLAEERRRLQDDHEVLREREENLREYEARLRALQAEIEASRAAVVATPAAAAPVAVPARPTPSPFGRPSSLTPFGDEIALQAAWEKLHRARELLEVEQTHLRDDRVVIHDQMETFKRREEELAEREAALAEREALIAAATPQPVASEHTMSAMTRLTTAPFTMARSVFGGKKKNTQPG
jgi:hypothetical protein